MNTGKRNMSAHVGLTVRKLIFVILKWSRLNFTLAQMTFCEMIIMISYVAN